MIQLVQVGPSDLELVGLFRILLDGIARNSLADIFLA